LFYLFQADRRITGLENSLFLRYWIELSGSLDREQFHQSRMDGIFQPMASNHF